MKLWSVLRSILLCFLGAWGAGLIVCRVLGLAPAGGLLLALGGGLCGGLAFLCQSRSRAASGVILGVGLFCAAAISGAPLQSIPLTVCAVSAGLMCFGAVILGGWGFYGPLGVWSVVLLCLAALLTGTPGVRSGMVALLSLGLTLDGFRENSVRRGRLLHRDAPLKDAFGLSGNSRLLLIFFLLAAVAAALGLMGVFSLILGGLKQLGRFLLTGTGKLGYGVALLLGKLITWLLSLLPSLRGKESAAPRAEFKFDMEPYDGGSPASTLLLVILLAAAAAAVATVSGTLILRHGRPERKAPPEVRDYEDLVEKLVRPKRRPFSRRGRRKAKISDYRGTMKIRFALQQLLKKRMEENGAARAKTPNELRRAGHPDENILIDSYNRVRYGNSDVTEAEIAAAERVVKAL